MTPIILVDVLNAKLTIPADAAALPQVKALMAPNLASHIFDPRLYPPATHVKTENVKASLPNERPFGPM